MLKSVYNMINCWTDPYEDRDAEGNSLYEQETKINVRDLSKTADNLRAALARPSAPETLAWAVVDTDRDIVWCDAILGEDVARVVAQHEGGRAVRVAIRKLEDEA